MLCSFADNANDNQSIPPNNGDIEEREDVGEVVPKAKIIAKIQEIAEYKRWTEPGRMANRMCWIVKPEVISDTKWQLHGLNISEEGPDIWQYTLEQPKTARTGTPSTAEAGEKESGITSNSASPTNTPKRNVESLSARHSDKPTKSPAPHSLITKFTKILTPEDRLKQMTKLKEKADAEREANMSKVQNKIAAITKELLDENSKLLPYI